MQEILNDIQTQKEILSTMPTNTKKNIDKYNKKIEELQVKYKEYLEKVTKEIESRYEKEMSVKKNKEIEEIHSKLDNIEENLDLLNKYKTSFEKMGFDRTVSKLRRYYKQDMDNVNEAIEECISIFEKVGINLTIDDFNYNKYSQEYMEEFLNSKSNIDFKKLKKKFEKLYWKCPDIIIYIEINIRSLYLKNQKIIDKYYKNKTQEFLKQVKLDESEIEKEYQNLKLKEIELQELDKHNLIYGFVEGDMNIKDYTNSKIKDIYKRMLTVDMEKMKEEEVEEVKINIIKLINNLFEYKKYLEYKFIINEIKKVYKDKEKYKNIYETNKKSIIDKESKMLKLEVKHTKNTIFSKIFAIFNKKNSNEKGTTNNLMDEIKEQYKQLEIDKAYEIIANNVNDDTSLLEVLRIASSMYIYILKLFMNEYKDEDLTELEKRINDLEEFMKWPYFTILNNISILEEKDIDVIIKDRYNLLNIRMTKEDLEEGNIEELMSSIKPIKVKYYLDQNGISVEKITNLCEYKKILNK